jgi:hypothetical protein
MKDRAPVTANRATPPFLLLATLAFWGWLSGLLIPGILMGVIAESSRFTKARFDVSADDFRRLWNFCGLLGVALVLYTFTTNEEGGGFGNLLHGSDAGRNAMLSSVHVATVIPRWLPIILFLLLAAQNFSERGTLPLTEVSIFFRWFRRNRSGSDTAWNVNVSYPYFVTCVFSAGIHANEGTYTYFWGLGFLLAWALWPLRSRRFHFLVWAGAFLLAVILAYFGTRGIGQLEVLAQNYNARWMARWMRQRTDAMQAVTSIGQIGELKLSSSIVIRLETPAGESPPTYLHEASYRLYAYQAWHAGGSQSDFQYVLPETNGGSTYELLPGQTANRDANIACYLNGWNPDLHVPEGLLPLPTGSSRLENVPESVVSMRMNKTGAVLAAGPGLVIFNARYGAAGTIDSPPDTNWDLNVPTNELPALKKVIGEMKISGTSDEEKELAVAHFLYSKFTYSTWQRPDTTRNTTNGTPLARFLLDTRSGHCEYFATATVLLLRELKIRARYAVGYYVHEGDGANHYVVRERDAHAWCMVWDRKKSAWVDFDTTPGSWIATEGERASAMQSVSDFFSWLQFQYSKFRYGQTHMRNYILWAVIPAMMFLLYQIIFRRGRSRRKQSWRQKNPETHSWPGLDSEFYELESRLASRGVPRQSGETITDWLVRILAENSLRGLRAPVQEALQLHYRHRFDPKGLEPGGRELLKQKVRVVLKSLAEK